MTDGAVRRELEAAIALADYSSHSSRTELSGREDFEGKPRRYSRAPASRHAQRPPRPQHTDVREIRVGDSGETHNPGYPGCPDCPIDDWRGHDNMLATVDSIEDQTCSAIAFRLRRKQAMRDAHRESRHTLRRERENSFVILRLIAMRSEAVRGRARNRHDQCACCLPRARSQSVEVNTASHLEERPLTAPEAIDPRPVSGEVSLHTVRPPLRKRADRDANHRLRWQASVNEGGSLDGCSEPGTCARGSCDNHVPHQRQRGEYKSPPHGFTGRDCASQEHRHAPASATGDNRRKLGNTSSTIR